MVLYALNGYFLAFVSNDEQNISILHGKHVAKDLHSDHVLPKLFCLRGDSTDDLVPRECQSLDRFVTSGFQRCNMGVSLQGLDSPVRATMHVQL